MIARSLHKLLQSPYLLYSGIALGLLLRLLTALIYSADPISDFADYHELAQSIAGGEGYAVQGIKTAFRPVGWPALLGGMYGLFGSSWAVGFMLNLGLSVIFMYLTYRLALAFTQNPIIAHIALLLIAIHPNSIAYCQLLSAELAFVCSMLAAIFVWIKGKEKSIFGLVLSGLLFGFATLVKSQGLLLPIVLIWFLGKRKKRLFRLRQLAWIYTGILLCLAPWSLRNQLVFGQFPVLVTNGSANLLVGNNPFANGKYKWGDQEIAWYGLQGPKAEDELAHAAKARKLAFTYLQSQPAEALKRLPSKLWYTYKADYDGLDWLRESCGGLTGWRHRLMQAWKAFSQLFYLFLLIASLFSFIRKSTNQSIKNQLISNLTFSLFIYFSCIVMLFFGDGRFHFPLIPWLCICTASVIIPNSWKAPTDAQAQS